MRTLRVRERWLFDRLNFEARQHDLDWRQQWDHIGRNVNELGTMVTAGGRECREDQTHEPQQFGRALRVEPRFLSVESARSEAPWGTKTIAEDVGFHLATGTQDGLHSLARLVRKP